MNGPEHYRAAEVLLESCQIEQDGDLEVYAAVVEDDGDDGADTCRNALMAAQAHATLALAAANSPASAEPRGVERALREALGSSASRAMLRAMLLDAADGLGDPQHLGNKFPWPDHSRMFRGLAKQIGGDS